MSNMTHFWDASIILDQRLLFASSVDDERDFFRRRVSNTYYINKRVLTLFTPGEISIDQVIMELSQYDFFQKRAFLFVDFHKWSKADLQRLEPYFISLDLPVYISTAKEPVQKPIVEYYNRQGAHALNWIKVNVQIKKQSLKHIANQIIASHEKQIETTAVDYIVDAFVDNPIMIQKQLDFVSHLVDINTKISLSLVKQHVTVKDNKQIWDLVNEITSANKQSLLTQLNEQLDHERPLIVLIAGIYTYFRNDLIMKDYIDRHDISGLQSQFPYLKGWVMEKKQNQLKFKTKRQFLQTLKLLTTLEAELKDSVLEEHVKRTMVNNLCHIWKQNQR
ncbi:hypothetical protein N9N03_00350 [Chlamydiia bacterium]|nr:hypothetical protein [Chlamydiia bacterium]